MKKSYRIGSSFHQKSIEVHRTENNVERRAKEVRFFCTLFAPVCRFAEQVEQVVGQGSLERICPDFGQRKKEGIGNQYLPKGTLPDAKNRIKIRKSRQSKRFRLFLRPVCPCVPLWRAGGVVAGKGSLERICPDFGRRKKKRCLEQVSAREGFARCEKCLQSCYICQYSIYKKINSRKMNIKRKAI